MIYLYDCRNEKCENCNETVEISKPMMESDRVEKCEKCDTEMFRVYTSFAMRSGDGYKA